MNGIFLLRSYYLAPARTKTTKTIKITKATDLTYQNIYCTFEFNLEGTIAMTSLNTKNIAPQLTLQSISLLIGQETTS